jgi:hypothetical protein
MMMCVRPTQVCAVMDIILKHRVRAEAKRKEECIRPTSVYNPSTCPILRNGGSK